MPGKMQKIAAFMQGCYNLLIVTDLDVRKA